MREKECRNPYTDLEIGLNKKKKTLSITAE